jgi:hypothetical protein
MFRRKGLRSVMELERTITVKKLWKGKYVSLRDNWIKFGQKKGGLYIRYNGQSMFLLPDDLKCGTYSGTFKSKMGKGSYKLYDFVFTPNLDTRQGNLL